MLGRLEHRENTAPPQDEKESRQSPHKTPMDGQFGERVKGAQDHVECDPGKRKPARPVLASEHKGSTDDR